MKQYRNHFFVANILFFTFIFSTLAETGCKISWLDKSSMGGKNANPISFYSKIRETTSKIANSPNSYSPSTVKSANARKDWIDKCYPQIKKELAHKKKENQVPCPSSTSEPTAICKIISKATSKITIQKLEIR